MRITTFLNRTIGLPGLWIKGVRIEEAPGEKAPIMVIEIQRRFQLLTCPECQAVRTEEVPWARAGSHFTRVFEDAVGLLAQQLNHTAVAELTGISWATVGRIAERLVGEKLHEDYFEGLRRIGVDEISYRKHHKYLTVVMNHDRNRVIWAGVGKSGDTLGEFFEELGPERARRLEIVSIDMPAGYEKAILDHAPQAEIVFDRFHVARLANDALTEIRREEARKLEPSERAARDSHPLSA